MHTLRGVYHGLLPVFVEPLSLCPHLTTSHHVSPHLSFCFPSLSLSDATYAWTVWFTPYGFWQGCIGCGGALKQQDAHPLGLSQQSTPWQVLTRVAKAGAEENTTL